MKNQYLLVAESIIYKNSKLTAINIYDQFLAMQLPAEFSFDLAILCGPGWEPGDYDLDIFVKPENDSEVQLGTIKINVPNESFVYNAIATNLNLSLKEGIKKIAFVVKAGDEVVIDRDFQVNTLADQDSK